MTTRAIRKRSGLAATATCCFVSARLLPLSWSDFSCSIWQVQRKKYLGHFRRLRGSFAQLCQFYAGMSHFQSILPQVHSSLSHTASLLPKFPRPDFFGVYLCGVDEFASQSYLRKMDNCLFCHPHFLLLCFHSLWLIVKRSSVLAPPSLSQHGENLGRFAVKTYALGPLAYPRRALCLPWCSWYSQKTKQNKSPILKWLVSPLLVRDRVCQNSQNRRNTSSLWFPRLPEQSVQARCWHLFFQSQTNGVQLPGKRSQLEVKGSG